MLLSFVTSPNQLAYSQSEYNKTNSPNVIGHGAGAQTKVGKNRAWSDLSETEREAARFLGFDAESWDTDSKVYIDRLTWEELSPAQRKAAKTLSFNKKTWNDDGKPYEAARMPLHTRVQSIIARAVEINVGMLIFLPVAFAHCNLNLKMLCERYHIVPPTLAVFVDIYERSWGELTSEQKAAAKELGYRRSVWDRDGPVWSDSKAWRDLTKRQQAAAATIGYTPQEWDETRRVYEKPWAQLNQARPAATPTRYRTLC